MYEYRITSSILKQKVRIFIQRRLGEATLWETLHKKDTWRLGQYLDLLKFKTFDEAMTKLKKMNNV